MKIAIHGPMCSGKTTISDIIKKHDPEYKTYSFGLKVKEIAKDLFDMKGKDRTLIISVASKMREINPNVWANYVIKQIEVENNGKCIIDDLRFQNEADHLKNGWIIICLTTPKEIRIERIKSTYTENSEDHIKNMDHISETDKINFPENTIYIVGSMEYSKLEEEVIKIISC